MWIIRLLIARSGIIVCGIVLGFAIRFVLGPPKTDRIDVSQPVPEAVEHYRKIQGEYEVVNDRLRKDQADEVGDVLIDPKDWNTEKYDKE